MPSPIGCHACPMEQLLPGPTQSHPLTQAVPTNVLRQSVLDDKNSFYYKFYIATYFLSENYTLFRQLAFTTYTNCLVKIIYTSVYFNP